MPAPCGEPGAMSTLPKGITLLPSGRYRARVKLAGHDQSATFSTPAAAVRWREETRDALRAGRPAPAPTPPVAEPAAPVDLVSVYDAYRLLGPDMVSGRFKAKSREAYKPSVCRRTESVLRVHVLPRIGRVPVAALDRRTVQRLVDQLETDASAETARKAVHALGVLMRWCEWRELVDRSPVERIRTASQQTTADVRVLTRQELAAALTAAESDDMRLKRSFAVPLIRLAVGTGCRLGELLALTWADTPTAPGVDLDGAVIRVRHSLDRARDRETGRYRIVAPKTRAGVRDIPLAAGDVAMLRRHRLACGRPGEGALVFSDRGQPVTPNGAPRHTWRRVAAAAGIDPLPRFHDLRHTWCVHALRAGVRPEALAKLGGWSGTAMIHQRYGRHVLAGEAEAAADQLAAWRLAAGGTT